MTEPGHEVATRADRRPADLTAPLADLDTAWRIAQAFAQTTMVPRECHHNPGNTLILLLTGQELGLSLAQTVRTVYITKGGRPGLMGKLVLAKVREAGHDYDIAESEGRCAVTITRGDNGKSYTGEFTSERAVTAGLLTRMPDGSLRARSKERNEPKPWELYGPDMLLWRAVARAVDRACPEVTLGFGIVEADDSSPPPGAGPQYELRGAHGPVPAGPLPDDVRQQVADLDAEMRGEEEDPGQVTVPAGPGAPGPQGAGSRPAGPGTEPAARSGPGTPAPPREPEGNFTSGAAVNEVFPQARMADAGQLRRLGIRFTDMGRSENDARLFACSVWVRRWISSSSELTSAEASGIYTDLGTIARAARGDKTEMAAMLAGAVEDRRAAWERDDPAVFEVDAEIVDDGESEAP